MSDFNPAWRKRKAFWRWKFKRCGQHTYNNMKEYVLPINTFLTVWHFKMLARKRERDRTTDMRWTGRQKQRGGAGKAPPPPFLSFTSSLIVQYVIIKSAITAESKTHLHWRRYSCEGSTSRQPEMLLCSHTPSSWCSAEFHHRSTTDSVHQKSNTARSQVQISSALLDNFFSSSLTV